MAGIPNDTNNQIPSQALKGKKNLGKERNVTVGCVDLSWLRSGS